MLESLFLSSINTLSDAQFDRKVTQGDMVCESIQQAYNTPSEENVAESYRAGTVRPCSSIISPHQKLVVSEFFTFVCDQRFASARYWFKSTL